MPEDSHINIVRVAELARMKLAEDEVKLYEAQLNGILAYIDTLTKYDLGAVEPTSHAIPVFDVLRADEPRPGFTQEQALSNAPKRTADQFQIPKVIE